MPAVHPKLDAVLSGSVHGLRVAVIDLEDSVPGDRVNDSVRIVRQLGNKPSATGLSVYVRPRTPDQLRLLVGDGDNYCWCGYVLPKVSLANLDAWLSPIAGGQSRLMPILESADLFCPGALHELCDTILQRVSSERIDAFRLGGTDLLGVVGTRRPRGKGIYESVVGPALLHAAGYLLSRKLPVSGPVCEMLSPDELMFGEIRQDVENGFIGKTAINPLQVVAINAGFAVDPEDVVEAKAILEPDRAVFASRGAMCEASPHAGWARRVLERHRTFGLKESYAPILESVLRGSGQGPRVV